MFYCYICHSTNSTIQTTNEVFQINDKFYLVENIPVQVCDHCGEESFSRETTEKIRKMFTNQLPPSKQSQWTYFLTIVNLFLTVNLELVTNQWLNSADLDPDSINA